MHTTWLHPATRPVHPIRLHDAGRALLVLLVLTVALVVALTLPTAQGTHQPGAGSVTGTTVDAGPPHG
jgi:hypothetical protein